MTVIDFPVGHKVPQHIAIIMDGNRRWAQQRSMPKALGHARGAQRVRGIVQACSDRGIRYLTLFAFSTENWQRPPDEVSSLMGLFVRYLEKEVDDMVSDGIRLKVVGDIQRFDIRLQKLMLEAEERTAANEKVTLTIAANYGGRWDMLQAAKSWQRTHPHKSLDELNEDAMRPHLAMAYAPDPDLLIRTGGESRISNFMLWQSAYTELYFTPKLWPDFTQQVLNESLDWYFLRDRRFGGVSKRSAC
jgi:undecaprenyl diphosphate synthase